MARLAHRCSPTLVTRGSVPQVGWCDPELRIEHDGNEVEIVVYNRAILLFTTEAVRRIHRVCRRLDDIAGLRRPA